MKPVFIDSDILLDALLNRNLYNKAAIALLELVHNKKFEGYTSSVAIVNIHYFLNKNEITRPHR